MVWLDQPVEQFPERLALVVHKPDICRRCLPVQRARAGHCDFAGIVVYRRNRPVAVRHDYAVDRAGLGSDLFLFGVPLGIVSAYSKTTDTIVKPILDTMQTMPVFVYLVPVVMFFQGGQVSAVIATVIYALPPIVRCTTLGLRELPEQIDEVSNSFGASTLQTLVKVKIPMAIPAVMLGINQGIMMALAMEVVTPLIGGKGLGLQVFDGMNMASLGLSLQAGVGIVLLAIILDRMSQAWTRTQREAMGLT